MTLEQAQQVLINYGSKFLPELVTNIQGVDLYTSDGHRLLDWTSGQMAAILSHGHPEIVKTIAYHAQDLDHLLSARLSPPVIQLATKLTSLLPAGLDRAMFLTTGGEACDAAIKLAKVFTLHHTRKRSIARSCWPKGNRNCD